jgi:hypothetical protein
LPQPGAIATSSAAAAAVGADDRSRWPRYIGGGGPDLHDPVLGHHARCRGKGRASAPREGPGVGAAGRAGRRRRGKGRASAPRVYEGVVSQRHDVDGEFVTVAAGRPRRLRGARCRVCLIAGGDFRLCRRSRYEVLAC